jgi:hypothetical protein
MRSSKSGWSWHVRDTETRRIVATIRGDGDGGFHLFSVHGLDETHRGEFASAQEAFAAFTNLPPANEMQKRSVALGSKVARDTIRAHECMWSAVLALEGLPREALEALHEQVQSECHERQGPIAGFLRAYAAYLATML